MVGQGLMLVHQYPKATGICTVIPTEFANLPEGWYQATFSRSIYTNFNLGITINQGSKLTYEEMEKAFKEAGIPGILKGKGVGGLMTEPIWPFEVSESIFH